MKAPERFDPTANPATRLPNRLEQSLAKWRELSAKGIAPYVTAGDGGLETTLAVLRALAKVPGVAFVEVGLPFSDPIADGPVLQAAHERALAAGTTFAGVLECIERFRAESELPVVVMTYANPLVRRGWDRSCRAIKEAGADGLLVADLPVEEAAEMTAAAEETNLCPIFFVAPTTSDERIVNAVNGSRGFVYVIGRLGVTGAGMRLDRTAERFLRSLRLLSGPRSVAVGFGIATAQDVAAATRFADVAIVGSALVRYVHEAFERSGRRPEAAASAARAFASELLRGLER
jgi:tryptophan synthase alpha chain